MCSPPIGRFGASRRALLFDEEDNRQADDIGAGDSNDDDDLNSLMDRGLEEIDDLLSTKGRLSVFGLPQASSEGAMSETGNHRLVPAGGRVDPGNSFSVAVVEGKMAAASDGGREQPEENVCRLSPDSGQGQQHRSARGTGANAASVLMSATAPTGSAGAVDSSFLGRDSKKRELVGSSSGVVIDGDDRRVHSRDQARHEIEGETRSYVYEAGELHRGGNADRLYSPPRRRDKEATPFIHAKGLNLTYAQAKLFGLAGSSHPADAGVMKNGLKTAAVTWPGSGPHPQTAGTRCTGLGGGARDTRQRQRQSQPRRTYSPSRMEQLSNPVPRRGRFGDSCSGGGRSADCQQEGDGHRGVSNAPFTWKRSRKAEAAMRLVRCNRVQCGFYNRETTASHDVICVEQRLQPVRDALGKKSKSPAVQVGCQRAEIFGTDANLSKLPTSSNVWERLFMMMQCWSTYIVR